MINYCFSPAIEHPQLMRISAYLLIKIFDVHVYARKCGIVFKQEILIYIYQDNPLETLYWTFHYVSPYILLYKFRKHQKSWIDMYSEWTHSNVSWEISNHLVSFARILPIFELCFPVILLWSGTWENNHYKRSLDQFSTVQMLLEIVVASSTIRTLLVWTNYCF